MTANTADYNFITDRLAIGNVASRAVPGFCAVVSVLTVEGRHRGRPWSAELTEKAPKVPSEAVFLAEHYREKSFEIDLAAMYQKTVVLVLDIADGEASSERSAFSCQHEDDRDLDYYLDDATAFIAEHIKRGCVLVHCGAGLSRSAAVVIAYLCRYAGMSYSEALSFVKARRPSVAPADCFKAAIERWLSLRALAEKGLRR